MRRSEGLRRLARETRLTPEQLILPVFVVPGRGVHQPIASMPGVSRRSVDGIVEQAHAAKAAGLGGLILFGVPDQKDARGSGGTSADGLIPQALRAIKEAVLDLTTIADVCLCEYTDHGHCGVIGTVAGAQEVLNDESLPLLAEMALACAKAGADIVAPSDMMDGRVAAIRARLDESQLSHVPILSYAAKYASAFYGPFRDAAGSAPAFGDRRGYQMDPANAREALAEVEADLDEGADMVMVKPALAYLDVIARVRDVTRVPVAAYNVSGEYALVKAGAASGLIDERRAVLEILTSIRRAGADFILTYHALDAARWLI